jgi:hypothetical protein
MISIISIRAISKEKDRLIIEAKDIQFIGVDNLLEVIQKTGDVSKREVPFIGGCIRSTSEPRRGFNHIFCGIYT